LKAYNIDGVTLEMHQKTLHDSAPVELLRIVRKLFKEVHPQRYGRYVMVVDRRDPNSTAQRKTSSDKLYVYSPNCNQNYNYHQLHQDWVSESLAFKSLKCLFPSVRKKMQPHFGCGQRDCITLSFHVLQQDVIRCYLYVDGGGARFEPADLIQLLPNYFTKPSTRYNKQDVEQKFGLELSEKQFETWYNKTTISKLNEIQ